MSKILLACSPWYKFSEGIFVRIVMYHNNGIVIHEQGYPEQLGQGEKNTNLNSGNYFTGNDLKEAVECFNKRCKRIESNELATTAFSK